MKNSSKSYNAPAIKSIELEVLDIICQSGGTTSNSNEWMREEDLGDGGFH